MHENKYYRISRNVYDLVGKQYYPQSVTFVPDENIIQYSHKVGYNGREYVERHLKYIRDKDLYKNWYYFIDTMITIINDLHKRGYVHLNLRPESFRYEFQGKGWILDTIIDVHKMVSKYDPSDSHLGDNVMDVSTSDQVILSNTMYNNDETENDFTDILHATVYSAPEVQSCDINNIAQASDVFSLGTIIHEISSSIDMVVVEDLDNLISKCTHHDPRQRPTIIDMSNNFHNIYQSYYT